MHFGTTPIYASHAHIIYLFLFMHVIENNVLVLIFFSYLELVIFFIYPLLFLQFDLTLHIFLLLCLVYLSEIFYTRK